MPSVAGPTSYDAFRPKFPLEPFTQSQSSASGRRPWTLDLNAARNPPLLHLERRVILTVGQPVPSALDALFESPQLTSSLVIIACHKPPPVPSRTYPAVHILRLRSHVAIEDAGASRLMDILEWALQVASLWRKTNGPRLQELLEEISPTPDSVKLSETYGRLKHGVAYEIPSYDSSASLPERGARTSRRWTLKSFRRQSSQKSEQGHVRPFDCIINFLPANASDKATLKAVILVTTLTRPYLSHPPDFGSFSGRFGSNEASKSRSSLVRSKSMSRWSFFRGSKHPQPPVEPLSDRRQRTISSATMAGPSSSSISLPALSRATKARILHVFPSAIPRHSSRPKASIGEANQAQLIRSMETFLLPFCYGDSSSIPLAGMPKMDVTSECDRAVPYILPARALSEVLHVEEEEEDTGKSDWTLLELVFSGLLDSRVESSGTSRKPSMDSGKGKARATSTPTADDWCFHRAWISGTRDIVVDRAVEADIHEPPSCHPHVNHHADTLQVLEGNQRGAASRQKIRPPPDYVEPIRPGQPIPPTERVKPLRDPGLGIAQDPRSRKELKEKRKGNALINVNKRLPTPPEHPDEDELEDDDVYRSSIIAQRPKSKCYQNFTSEVPTELPDHHNRHRNRIPHAPAAYDARHVPKTNRSHYSAPNLSASGPTDNYYQEKRHRRSHRHPVDQYDLPTPPDSDEAEIDYRIPSVPSQNSHYNQGPYRYDDRARKYTPTPNVVRMPRQVIDDEFVDAPKHREFNNRGQRSKLRPYSTPHPHVLHVPATTPRQRPTPYISQPVPITPSSVASPPEMSYAPGHRAKAPTRPNEEENALGLKKSSLVTRPRNRNVTADLAPSSRRRYS